MNKGEFIDKIKEIKINVPDEQFFLKYNRCVYDILDKSERYKEVIDKVRDHIKSKITKSFEYDYGIDMSNSSDRLFTETVIELELIDEILKEVK